MASTLGIRIGEIGDFDSDSSFDTDDLSSNSDDNDDRNSFDEGDNHCRPH